MCTARASAAVAADPVSRDSAREAAARELSKGSYHADDPSLPQRVLDRVFSWLDRELSHLSSAAPGGPVGLLVLTGSLVALVWFVLWRVGPLRRAARLRPVLSAAGTSWSAADHRRRAEEYAAAGAYPEAVRERMRAIVRELETRGVLEPRPGRTADEVAAEAGAEVPGIAGPLRTAATIFDEVWYGRRPATADQDATMRRIDDEVRRAPLAVAH
jgi:hypothetical protein